jgi:type I restriction enzyme S subunit
MGGVQPNLNLEKVRALAVPLCSDEEAPVLTNLVHAALDRVNSLATIAFEQMGRVEVLDRSLLAKAFRGELVPQDPNDEPAEAMLNRVASTNGAAPTNGSSPKRGRSRRATRAEQPND